MKRLLLLVITILLIAPATASAHFPPSTLANMRARAIDYCIHRSVMTKCWPSANKPGPGNWSWNERQMRWIDLHVSSTYQDLHVGTFTFYSYSAFWGAALGRKKMQATETFYHGGPIKISGVKCIANCTIFQ